MVQPKKTCVNRYKVVGLQSHEIHLRVKKFLSLLIVTTNSHKTIVSFCFEIILRRSVDLFQVYCIEFILLSQL